MHKSDNVITFENISKSYKDGKNYRPILRDISGSVKRGSINVILGESGCGKTTFLSILSGIERPDNGRVYYNDYDFYQLKPENRAELRGICYGIIFQDYNLIDELCGKDNILLPLTINKIKINNSFYHDLINRMKLTDIENSYPRMMSGGEKQRTAIARAMITKPDIIFADEPTGNLDETNSKEVVDILIEMNKHFNTTIMIVTHDKNLIANPDKIFYIHNGTMETTH